MRAPLAILVPGLVAALGCAACSSSAPAGPLVLGWRFADSRDCFSAGAYVIQARTTPGLAADAIGMFDCGAGIAPNAVMLATVPGSGTLYVDARSGQGADLYHGELSLDDAPPGTGERREVTLFAVAAQ